MKWLEEISEIKILLDAMLKQAESVQKLSIDSIQPFNEERRIAFGEVGDITYDIYINEVYKIAKKYKHKLADRLQRIKELRIAEGDE